MSAGRAEGRPLSATAALRAALLAACALVGSACSQPAPSPGDSTATLQALQQEIGGARCDSSAQCRTVAVGHKSCGGPERYLAWSVAEGDARRIAELAARQATQRRTEVERDGRVSNCALVTDPGAQCVAQRCVPLPGGGMPGRPAT